MTPDVDSGSRTEIAVAVVFPGLDAFCLECSVLSDLTLEEPVCPGRAAQLTAVAPRLLIIISLGAARSVAQWDFHRSLISSSLRNYVLFRCVFSGSTGDMAWRVLTVLCLGDGLRGGRRHAQGERTL